MEMGMINKLIAYKVPKTLILERNASSTMMDHGDLGATGLERPPGSFKDLNGPRWRFPWQRGPISQSPCEVWVVCMLVSVCVRLAGREGNGATFPGSSDVISIEADDERPSEH